MPPPLCILCNTNKAALKRPKTGQQLCKDCFFFAFEEEIHQVIEQNQLFAPGENVAIGASGGKGKILCHLYFFYKCLLDSTVLAEVMTVLNQRHNYGLNLFLLSIDEGITGYRDDSLEVREKIIDRLTINLALS